MTNSIKQIAFVCIAIIVTLLVIKIFNLSYPLSVTTSNVSSELSVIGEGKVDVRPDTATIDAGVVVNKAATVGDAQKTINDINNQIIKALTALKISKNDIKTSNYSIYPNYETNNTISGYNGNITISIKVRDVNKVADVVDAVTKAGANQIQNTQFTVDQPEKYREEARNKAIQNAKEQAQKLASNLGIRLGRVVNIVESTGGSVMPMMYDRAYATGMGGGGGPAVEPGSQTISSVVTLYFEKR